MEHQPEITQSKEESLEVAGAFTLPKMAKMWLDLGERRRNLIQSYIKKEVKFSDIAEDDKPYCARFVQGLFVLADSKKSEDVYVKLEEVRQLILSRQTKEPKPVKAKAEKVEKAKPVKKVKDKAAPDPSFVALLESL